MRNTKKGPRSDLSSEKLFHADVNIQTGSGFLNYINGYVVKASDCVDFSSKEYSAEDGSGAEAVEWKRTCRTLPQGAPALHEIYCHLCKEAELTHRSFAVSEAFPPVQKAQD